MNLYHTVTEKNKMIKFIVSYGYQVVENCDGTYTVTDSMDDADGWKIVNSGSALEETVKMILSCQK